MSEIYLISDTHFNHGNIIRFCNRPFKNTREMDEYMIEKWNSVVTPQDKVYHLGDVYMKASRGYIGAILHRLNGKKRLILGNHDNGKDQILQRHFQKIVMWRHFKIGKTGLLLSHVPLHPGSIRGDINIHGHIHDKPSPDKQYRCVCVEHIEYTPVNIEKFVNPQWIA